MMEKEEIEKIVNSMIRRHEIRVGWISGIIGIILLSGNLHAFWLIKTWMIQ